MGVIVVVNFHETGSIRRLKIVLATWEGGVVDWGIMKA